MEEVGGAGGGGGGGWRSSLKQGQGCGRGGGGPSGLHGGGATFHQRGLLRSQRSQGHAQHTQPVTE